MVQLIEIIGNYGILKSDANPVKIQYSVIRYGIDGNSLEPINKLVYNDIQKARNWIARRIAKDGAHV